MSYDEAPYVYPTHADIRAFLGPQRDADCTKPARFLVMYRKLCKTFYMSRPQLLLLPGKEQAGIAIRMTVRVPQRTPRGEEQRWSLMEADVAKIRGGAKRILKTVELAINQPDLDPPPAPAEPDDTFQRAVDLT